MQERIGAFDSNVKTQKQISTVIDCAHAALRLSIDMTPGTVIDLIDIANMGDVFAAVMDVSESETKRAGSRTSGENEWRTKFRLR